MEDLSTPKGFRDLYKDTADKFIWFDRISNTIARKYGCNSAITPAVEYSSLFINNMNDSSVVVDKEIFMLEKHGLCLRPEITAPIVRLAKSRAIHRGRISYFGPCFRGERPQAGRYRQFYQFGVEMIGGTNDVYDCISLLIEILSYIPKNFIISINNIGDEEVRKRYQDSLRQFLQNKPLSEVSKLRLKENRLMRILDSKEEQDKEILKDAPIIYDFLGKEQRNLLDNICKQIEKAKHVVKIDHNLVRGLDYYNGIVFEILNENGLAIGGGGEYNNLLKINKDYINCIGFAIGVDRIADYIAKIPSHVILLASNDINLLNRYAFALRSLNYNIITHQGVQDLKKISLQYDVDCVIILYSENVFLNRTITYEEFEKNNYAVLSNHCSHEDVLQKN